jgi:hypothetical protein
MESPQITTDLLEGAYLLCRGFKLERITVVGSDGKKLCTFAFGEGAKSASDEYREGRATCNVALLKYTLTHLKREMYKKMAAIEEREIKKEKDTCSASVRSRKQRETTRSRM